MEWLIYLLKVSTCMGLFYAFYHFFLQKLTFFNGNRYYLLSTLLISFAIPFIHLKVERVQMVNKIQEAHVTAIPKEGTGLEMLKKPRLSALLQNGGVLDYNWEHIIYRTYWIVSTAIMIMFLFQMLLLLKQIRNVGKVAGHLKVIYKSTGFTNCSFLNYVFVDKQDLTSQEMAVIIQHESVHISKYHSIDKLIIAICKILLWFNPLVYLYDKAVEQVHEYEADKETSSMIGNISYANLLLSTVVRGSNISLVHSFVKNPLKERIKMLFTSKSENMKKLFYLISFPIGLGLIWLFGVQIVYADAKDINSRITTNNEITFINKEIKIKGGGPEKSLKNGVPQTSRVKFSQRKNNTAVMLNERTKVHPEYSKEDETPVQVPAPEEMGVNHQDRVIENDKIYITAKDSVLVNKDKTICKLYGNAHLKYGNLNIYADEIIYNTKDSTGVAKNGIMKRKEKQTTAAFMEFDLKD